MTSDTEWFGGPGTDPVEIVEPDPIWPQLFERVSAQLAAALGPAAKRIDHVGSTAVPGLAAKPVIDIQVSVADVQREETYRPAIEALGWPLRAREHDNRFFRPPDFEERLVHVHVCSAGSRWERNHLLFVNYLRSHPHDATAYADLKRELAKRFGNDRRLYTEAKDAFVGKVMAAAEEWAAATAWRL